MGRLYDMLESAFVYIVLVQLPAFLDTLLKNEANWQEFRARYANEHNAVQTIFSTFAKPWRNVLGRVRLLIHLALAIILFLILSNGVQLWMLWKISAETIGTLSSFTVSVTRESQRCSETC